MSKYAPLAAHLKAQAFAEVPMRFSEIERVLHAKLPRSAYVHRPWWANETHGHVHAKSWLEAGYETAQVDMEGKRLVFRRVAPAARARGMEEGTRMYQAEDRKNAARHPAIGSMKGLITIAPGVDITDPVYTDEEWAEIEKEMEKDWDEIASRLMTRK